MFQPGHALSTLRGGNNVEREHVMLFPSCDEHASDERSTHARDCLCLGGRRCRLLVAARNRDTAQIDSTWFFGSSPKRHNCRLVSHNSKSLKHPILLQDQTPQPSQPIWRNQRPLQHHQSPSSRKERTRVPPISANALHRRRQQIQTQMTTLPKKKPAYE